MSGLITALVLFAAVSGGDYDPQNTAWNGLSDVASTAEEAHVTLQFADTFSWDSVSPGDIVLFAAPPPQLNAESLRAFLDDGGRAIVAVDGGAETSVLASFGLQIDPKPVIHTTYHHNHVRFPVVSPDSEHFLWFNVNELILNHPVALNRTRATAPLSDIKPLIRFDEPGQFFAVEWSSGPGRALFLSDASVFINEMQNRSYGTKQLSANALRFYCPADAVEPCDVIVVGPGSRVLGAYVGQQHSGLDSLEAVFARAVAQLNKLAVNANGPVSHALVHPRALWLALLCGVILLLLVANKPLSQWAVWVMTEGHRKSTAQVAAEALAMRRAGADFHRPLDVLCQRILGSLGSVLSLNLRARGSLDSDREQLTQALNEHGLGDLKEPVLRCLQSFHMVTENPAGESSNRSHQSVVSYELFQRTQEDGRRIESSLSKYRRKGERNES